MARAPVAGEAQVAMAEEAGDGDLPDVRDCVEARRFGLERGEPA
jgi:hypothetical protein